MIFLKLLIINLVVILIVDLSGFVQSLKRAVSRLFTKGKFNTDNYRIKPFDCSYCMTFWSLLLYLLLTHELTFITVFYTIVITHFTDVTKQVLLLLKDLSIKLIDTIYDRLQIK